MAITKTDFINFTRCPRYIALANLKKDRLDADVSYEEYEEQERREKLQEMLGSMYEEEENGSETDLIDVPNRKLEAMMKYYKQVEIEAAKIAKKYFPGTMVFAESTKNQECFDCNINGIRYLCYIDIYHENEEEINIIEVKATTNNKYLKMMGRHFKQDAYSIWHMKDNVMKLKGEIPGYPLEDEMPLDVYAKQREKLFDRYGIGKYVYDLTIQRYIIEHELKESNNKNISKFHYYLAVLNCNYIFDGTYENGEAVYHPDADGNELITFIDMDEVTKENLQYVDADRIKLENYIKNMDASSCPLGKSCEYKKPTTCKFFDAICGSMIPKKNSSLSYTHNGFGFVSDSGERIKGLDLINAGYMGMLDIPETWITKEAHKIQRDCLTFHHQYVNKEKLALGLKQLEYPIYHLDFETFPCPVPRFKGEWPYIQSPFEFSLHIEREPGICDKQKDNYVFLAKTHEDEREELIKMLIKYIDPSKGTLFAQNVAFEKGRIKELAEMFPEYKSKLMAIHAKGFDLLWLINTNSKMYQELGYSEEESKLFNFYDSYLSGSFSIKKTLPVFTDLKYDDLVVKNGNDAIIEYANYPYMSKEEYVLKYQALIDYCQQDTWAMVAILEGLRKLVK